MMAVSYCRSVDPYPVAASLVGYDNLMVPLYPSLPRSISLVLDREIALLVACSLVAEIALHLAILSRYVASWGLCLRRRRFR